MNQLATQIYIRLTTDQRGQTMAEYAIVLAVISIGIIAALTTLKGSIGSSLSKITSDI